MFATKYLQVVINATTKIIASQMHPTIGKASLKKKRGHDALKNI